MQRLAMQSNAVVEMLFKSLCLGLHAYRSDSKQKTETLSAFLF